MLRILLCAPESNLDQSAEIRDLTSLHNVTVLSGKVSTRDLYTATSARQYDIIHMACHGDQHGIYLCGQEMAHQRNLQPGAEIQRIPANELAQIARAANAKLVWLNACSTQALAASLVTHGVPYCIAAVKDIEDVNAWKTPLVFYTKIKDISDEMIVATYEHANDEQQYAMHVAPKLLLALLETISRLRAAISEDVQVTIPRNYLIIGIPITIILYAILIYLSWR